MKKKILIIENSVYITGGFNSIVAFSDALKNRFEFIYVFPIGSSVVENLRLRNYKVYTLPFLEIGRNVQSLKYPFRLYKNAKSILEIIHHEGINIVHVNDVFNQLGCVVKLLRPSTKVVYHVRLLKSSYIAPLYSYFAATVKKFADRIICVSDAVLNDINRPEKAIVVYDPVSPYERYPLWDGLNDSCMRILYLGNYTSGKGQNFGLEAFIKFNEVFPNSSITFYGDDQTLFSKAFKEKLIARAKESQVADKVSFYGKTNDVELTMKQYDLILNLSESESFSLITLEAMYYGIPIIVSDCGGPREITQNGRRALLVKNRDVEDAVDALTKIYRQSEKHKLIAAESKEWVKSYFEEGTSIKALDGIYSSLL